MAGDGWQVNSRVPRHVSLVTCHLSSLALLRAQPRPPHTQPAPVPHWAAAPRTDPRPEQTHARAELNDPRLRHTQLRRARAQVFLLQANSRDFRSSPRLRLAHVRQCPKDGRRRDTFETLARGDEERGARCVSRGACYATSRSTQPAPPNTSYGPPTARFLAGDRKCTWELCLGECREICL